MLIAQMRELRETLMVLFSRIDSGEDISEQLERIESLRAGLDASAPKMLLHYLERKSYTKALAFLEAY